MEGTNDKKSIGKNFFYNLLYEVIIILSPLIITPYVSRVLGVDLIGVRSYTYAILMYFELFANLGLAIYGQREIAKTADNKQERSRVFLSLQGIKVISFTCVTIIYCISFFGINLLENYDVIWKIWLIHLSETLFNITWYFQGIEKFKFISIRGIILRTLQIILTLCLIKSPADFNCYLIIYATIPLLQALSLWPFLINSIDFHEIKNIKIKKHVKNIFIFFIPTIATTIYSNVDKIMLGSMLKTTTQTGYYESAHAITLLATTIFTSIYTVMRSRVSSEVAQKKKNSINDFIKVAIFIVMPITLGILAISNKFIILFYGLEYIPVIKLLRIFCIVIFLMGISGFINAVYIVPYDKQKEISKYYIYATIINIILNAILIPRFYASGAIIGSIIAETIVFLGCIYLSRQYIPIKKYFEFGWKYMVSGLAMFILTFILDIVLPNKIIYLLIEIVVGGIFYIILLILTNDILLKTVLYSFLKKIKRKKK